MGTCARLKPKAQLTWPTPRKLSATHKICRRRAQINGLGQHQILQQRQTPSALVTPPDAHAPRLDFHVELTKFGSSRTCPLSCTRQVQQYQRGCIPGSTPNAPYDHKPSTMPCNSALRGNLHLLDDLKLLVPLIWMVANLTSATPERQH